MRYEVAVSGNPNSELKTQNSKYHRRSGITPCPEDRVLGRRIALLSHVVNRPGDGASGAGVVRVVQ